MKQIILLLISFFASITPSLAQKDYGRRVVCHDPSIFMDKYTYGTESNPRYYIYGSHLGRGYTDASSNYMSWTGFKAGEENTGTSNSLFANTSGSLVNFKDAYTTHAITKVKNCNGEEVAFGNFDAHGWQYKNNNVQGMEWAPDVIYNTTMNKWCMYMSLNGDNWCSSIVCFTSNTPEGPWVYQGPVVCSGFGKNFSHNSYAAADDWKYTDFTIATGETSLPERYNPSNNYGNFWPNCIDPCVFYDQDGKLWMSYGSWSGGIFIIELDETTGLRDYTVRYPYQVSGTTTTPGAANLACTCDPYFGKKIAGGCYVSGEASYIQYFNGYYYLFMSYGGLEAAKGYQIRVFRSQNPDGPYVDCCTSTGISAIYNTYRLNYGADAKRDEGVKLFGNYQWDSMPVAELAQGHNSAIVDHNGHLLLVYHTRFNNGTEGHQVRIHEMFQNEDGWLVASPFEYGGETPVQQDIESSELYSYDDIVGTYRFMCHPYRQNTAAKAYETPVDITLNADGTVSGSYTGSWSVSNSFITLTVKGTKTNNESVTFKGVLTEQTPDYTSKQALCFTVLSSSSGSASSGGAAVQTRALSAWGMKAADPVPTDATFYPVSQQKTTTSGWWQNFSQDSYTLKAGNSIAFKFYNYSRGTNNFDNWCLYGASGVPGASGYTEYFGVRCDNWDNTTASNNGCQSNYNWDTFKSEMNGSLVDMTVTYEAGGKFYMSSTITAKAGNKYNYSYSKTISQTPAQLTLFFVNEGSYIDGSSLTTSITHYLSPITQQPAAFNLSGQRVGNGYKGVVVRNGRKYIQQ